MRDLNQWRRAYQDLKALGRDYGAILVALTPFDIAYDLASLIAGRDLLSGHPLTTFDTVAILVGFFTAGLGDDILGGGLIGFIGGWIILGLIYLLRPKE